ncbi:MAG: tyrosine-type recombinase/integrase [Candidatus Omnitrophica bacterium]|nr:tyrosine-type recombinase/integrase [Candidatus Omnitrophota bacterium]
MPIKSKKVENNRSVQLDAGRPPEAFNSEVNAPGPFVGHKALKGGCFSGGVMDIHNRDRQYQRLLRGIRESDLSERNKDLLERFHQDLVLENLTKARLVKLVGTMKLLALMMGKDLSAATIEDVKRVVGRIQQREDLSSWTKRDYKIILRKFFKWLHKTKGYPEIVDWVKVGISRSEKRLPSDGELLTPQESIRLIEAATHPRDQALISLIWESGARVSEIGTLCLKDVCFDRFGVVITVRGKTGSRKIRLVTSTPYLATWMNCHPQKGDPSAPLWVNFGNNKHGKPMNYPGISKVLRVHGEKLNLKKRLNPHFFRHSRATHMANFLTEFQMNQYFGWIQGSNMPAVYIHMSGKEVDNAVLAMNGIKAEERESDQQKARVCKRCDAINSVSAEFCLKCGAVVDEKRAIEIQEEEMKKSQLRSFSDELMNQLLKDEDVQKLIAKKVHGMESMSL